MNNFFRSGLLSVSVVGMLISGAGSARADETTPPRDNAGNTTPAPTAPDNKATFSQPANISDESRQKAEAILQKVTDFYSHLKSFSFELVLDRVLKTTAASNADFKGSSTFDIAVKHPDKLSIVSTGGTPVLDAQSDGKTLNLYSPHLKKYVQLPALPTAQKTFRDPALHVSYVYLKPSCLDALLSQTPVRWNSFSLLPVASQAAYIGTEILDGAGTDKIKILAPKFSEIIYVDQGPEPWIRQIISLDENVAAMNVPENAPKMVSLSFTARYNHPSANPDLPENKFVFTPPADSAKTDSFNPPPPPQSPLIGKPAFDFVAEADQGKPVTLSNFKKKNVVLLEFWATWCGPCRRALPLISQVARDYERRGVIFYAVNEREDRERIEGFLAKNNLSCNILFDSAGSIGKQYSVDAIPTTIIIDRQGIIKAVHTGYSADIDKELSKELDLILDKNKKS